MNVKNFLVFAVIMFIASFIAGYLQQVLPNLSQYGVAGSIIAYLILLVPAYILLKKFWRKQ